MVLLVSLACSLQRPLARPNTSDAPPVNQQNQDPNLPPPPTDDAGSVPGVTPPTAGKKTGTGTLEILSPLDGATVNTAQIEVRGVAAPGAVVTVNDEILIADADGRFSVIIPLETGLNLIEVIASDALDNEAVIELTVIYEP